jgi:two-component system nitrogen regulation sensor histidine kinase NtrY
VQAAQEAHEGHEEQEEPKVNVGRAGGGYIHLALAGEAGATRLSVIDSGNGLGEASARQLFTPFFSTRKGGQGIGLVFVREVLNRHGFAYRLAPGGEGETRFDIWFSAPA